jgi:hypothetical protein
VSRPRANSYSVSVGGDGGGTFAPEIWFLQVLYMLGDEVASQSDDIFRSASAPVSRSDERRGCSAQSTGCSGSSRKIFLQGLGFESGGVDERLYSSLPLLPPINEEEA